MDHPRGAISLVTDSSCDLPSRLLERFRIAVVPLTVHVGTESYVDRALSMEEILERLEEVRSSVHVSLRTS